MTRRQGKSSPGYSVPRQMGHSPSGTWFSGSPVRGLTAYGPGAPLHGSWGPLPFEKLMTGILAVVHGAGPGHGQDSEHGQGQGQSGTGCEEAEYAGHGCLRPPHPLGPRRWRLLLPTMCEGTMASMPRHGPLLSRGGVAAVTGVKNGTGRDAVPGS
jgi:hypothetical protein